MRPEIKQKWVAALRSGDYEQGKMALQTSDGKFCCLGVLCDLHRKTNKKKGITWDPTEETEADVRYLGEDAFLPESVSEWAGLVNGDGESIKDPEVKTGNNLRKSLSELNDGGTSFKKIAEYIEKNL